MAKFNSAFADTAKGYNPKDYVPLDKREDWDGKVISLPTAFDLEPKKKLKRRK